MTSSLKSLSMSRTGWLIPIGFLTLLPIIAVAIVRIPSFHLIVLAACLLGIMTVPIIHSRQIDWFSPWNWLFYSTFLGVFLRSIYIAFDIPNSARIQQVFLGGESKEFLLMPMVVVLIGMSVMTLGYLAGPGVPRRVRVRVFQSDQWNEKRFWFLTLLLLSLSWMGLWFFIRNVVGSLGAENLSAAYYGVSDYLSQYRGYGFLRSMISLSDLASYIVAAKMISSGRTRFRELIVLLVALGTSLIFSVLVNQRGGVVWPMINILALIYYLRGRKLNIKGMVIAGIAILFLVGLISSYRAGSGFENIKERGFPLSQAVESIVLSLSLIDVSKTAHIMAAIPTRLDYQWGRTLIAILWAWIPRELWPGKPIFNADTTVGRAVFGATVYGAGGVPVGLIAEWYWNFWFPGIVVGCFAARFLLRAVYTQFKAYSRNRNVVLLYVTSFMTLGVWLAGSSMMPVMLGFLTSCMPMYVILHLITARQEAAT